MIVCPVCQHSNDDFAVTCSACGSYVQDRVPNLDFFSMIWLIIESPEQAFKKVIIAEHKNFVLFLGLFFGIGSFFTLLWGFRSGNSFDNLFPLLLFGSVVGAIFAIPMFYALAGTVHGFSRLLKGKAAFKETYGIVGWSLVPVMLSVVFILPLELGTLGLLLFSTNPSALEVKPEITVTLLALDGACVLWSALLGMKGLRMAHRFSAVTSAMVMILSVAVVAMLFIVIYSSFNI